MLKTFSRYPIRANKLYRQIDILTKHKCDITCLVHQTFRGYMNNTIENENESETLSDSSDTRSSTTFFTRSHSISIPDSISSTSYNCGKNNQIQRHAVHLHSFNNIYYPFSTDHLCNEADIILQTCFYKLYIEFPLQEPVVIEKRYGRKRNLTLGMLLNDIKNTYFDIYKEEEETSTPFPYWVDTDCLDCSIFNIQQVIDNCAKIASNESCIICMENMNEGIVLNCGHNLHHNCIDEWVMTGKNTCPICRTCIKSCELCNGEMIIKQQFWTRVIPIAHRPDPLVRNRTDGKYGIHSVDFENLFISRLYYDRNSNQIYMKMATFL